MNGTRIGSGGRQYLYASTTDTYDETADLDYIAVEYALNGQPAKLTIAEKIHAARILHGRGFDLTAIGHRIGSDRTTIAGWRDNGWKPGGGQPKSGARQTRPGPVCGEPRMYRRHVKAGERCDTCRAANAAADRRYRLSGSRKETA